MDEVTAGKLTHRRQDGSLITVSEYITPWIEQPCFPRISVELVEPGLYKLTQRCNDEASNDIWPILITYITSCGNTGSFMMTDAQ